MPANSKAITGSLSSLNDVTGSLIMRGGPPVVFNFSISGTFVGTVAIQRLFSGSTWLDVKTYTAPAEEIGTEPENDVLYRLKMIASTSGTAVVRLSY